MTRKGLVEFALTTDDGRPLHLTGLSVADVLEGHSDWSAQDVKAFARWLEEPHVKASAKEAQELLLEARSEITAWACEEPPKGIKSWRRTTNQLNKKERK
jgi:hypothetical protein